MGQFGLQCLSLNADDTVYFKLVMIKWLNGGLYDKIFLLLGFHTLFVKLKLLHKKFGLLEMKDWPVDKNVVTVDKAAEAKHYCCLIRLHKQTFEAYLFVSES